MPNGQGQGGASQSRTVENKNALKSHHHNASGPDETYGQKPHH